MAKCSFRRPPKKPLYLYFDATDDRVHGQQLGRHFNGCYNHYIFLPLFVFRGDSGFCRPLILNWCDRHGVDYIISLAGNKRLAKLTGKLVPG
ncbi:Transposase DDE domain group 1 [Vreelandella aquamarina]|jgi:hypothetical protein|uniref:Transposase DDE domain group 1 n=1 Tax=Vreelandella aquamarina TaxID=77097 RepID=A0A1H8GNM3_9GAMM|nr:Transposase DDE domain group 1 [Halomonas aquamarina]